MKQIRERLGMTREQFASALGYTGTDRNNETRVRKYENQCDRFPIPLYIARLAWLIEQVFLRKHPLQQNPFGDIKGFPDWPGYEFEHTPDSPSRDEGLSVRDLAHLDVTGHLPEDF